jgi:hypothetical protein
MRDADVNEPKNGTPSTASAGSPKPGKTAEDPVIQPASRQAQQLGQALHQVFTSSIFSSRKRPAPTVGEGWALISVTEGSRNAAWLSVSMAQAVAATRHDR